MPDACRHHERRRAVVGRQVRVGPRLQEDTHGLHHLHVSAGEVSATIGTIGRDPQRRGVSEVPGTDRLRFERPMATRDEGLHRRGGVDADVRVGPVIEPRLHQRDSAGGIEAGRGSAEHRDATNAEPVAQPHVDAADGGMQRADPMNRAVGVRALIQQEPRERIVAADDRQREGVRAVRPAGVHVSACSDQDLHRLAVAVARHKQQRREPDLRLGLHVGTCGDQLPHDVPVALGGRPHQRGLPRRGNGSRDADVARKQRPHDLDLPRSGRPSSRASRRSPGWHGGRHPRPGASQPSGHSRFRTRAPAGSPPGPRRR